jgi:integrase
VKSDAGQDRRLPIIGALLDHLGSHRARAGARPMGLVFPRGSLAGAGRGHRGDLTLPFSDSTVGQRAHKRWNDAGLLGVSLHDCRHTFASLMIAATAAARTFNPKTIQMMLGHASIVQTYDRYGHLFPGAEQEAGRHLDAFLEGAATAGEQEIPSVTPDLDAVGDRQASVPHDRIRPIR